MRPLELIPARWLEYEPPSLCRWAAAGAIASIAGTGLSILSSSRESGYQAAVARNQALIDRQKANEDAAIGQREAITQSRKTDLALSRARALGASSGTDPLSPTQVDLEGQLAQQGGYNALSALYEGMTKSQNDAYQADLDLFKAKRINAAAPLIGLGQGLSGIASLANNKSLVELFK